MFSSVISYGCKEETLTVSLKCSDRMPSLPERSRTNASSVGLVSSGMKTVTLGPMVAMADGPCPSGSKTANWVMVM